VPGSSSLHLSDWNRSRDLCCSFWWQW